MGFNVNIDIKNLPSKVIFISSHTSIYDFFIGMIIYYGYLHKKYKLYCLMKKLFESMVSPFLLFIDNKVKIISVDKTKNGLTTKIIETLKTKDNYLIFIAPEGTRKITQTLRKGYWIIAKELNIDVIYVGIDFHKKYIQLEKNRKVDENWNIEQDNFIQEAIKYTPLYPEKFYWTKNYYDTELVHE
jgi:1-acyl-sn-glycerol-3-phosphate acyltransferase